MVKRVGLKFPYWVSKLCETALQPMGDPLTSNAIGAHSRSVTELRHHLQPFSESTDQWMSEIITFGLGYPIVRGEGGSCVAVDSVVAAIGERGCCRVEEQIPPAGLVTL